MRIKPVSLIVILFASITGPFGQISVLAATRPNVVLIMCDDMGYEGVSVYGSSTYDTPNLDGLAKSGCILSMPIRLQSVHLREYRL